MEGVDCVGVSVVIGFASSVDIGTVVEYVDVSAEIYGDSERDVAGSVITSELNES